MEFKGNKDFLFATRLTRLTTFLETDEEKRKYRNAVYNAIIWGKRYWVYNLLITRAMKVIKEIQDWYKANILGDQSLQKAREQRLFERRIDDAINHVVLSDKPNDNGIPYPVVCINGTVVYKVCSNPRLEKGEIGLENVGEVLTRLRTHYAKNELNYR